jgi:hypothetical protein
MTENRKNFRDALNHVGGGKIPVDFGATVVTGMHVSCAAALRDYFGFEKKPVKVVEPFQMLGEIDDELKEALGVTVEGIFGPANNFGFRNEGWKPWVFNGLDVLVPERFNVTADAAGNIFMHPGGDTAAAPSGRMPKGGFYFDALIRQEAFDDADLNPEDNLAEFAVLTEQDISFYKTSAEKAALTGRGTIMSLPGCGLGDIALVPGLALKRPKGIRDVEEWYVSTLTRQDLLHEIFDRQTDIALDNIKMLYAAVGGLADAVFLCGTDFGTQTGTFCSKETFDSLYAPHYKKMTGWIRENTSWKILKHSCGAVGPLMDSFIKAGFDILNPVQCSASGMAAAALKQKYGGRLVFWGGGADTQQTLPFGSPEQVADEVRGRCETFSEGGGFVFNAIHNIQAGTPVENVAAMIGAVKKFNSEI